MSKKCGCPSDPSDCSCRGDQVDIVELATNTELWTVPGMRSVPCSNCYYPYTRPSGACHICPECGTTSGCS